MKPVRLILVPFWATLGALLLRAADPQPPAPKPVVLVVDLAHLQAHRIEMEDRMSLLSAIFSRGTGPIYDQPTFHLWRGEQHLKMLFVSGREKKADVLLKPNDIVMVGDLTPEAFERLAKLPEFIDAQKHSSKEPLRLDAKVWEKDVPQKPFSF
jgi:hypothetical protein